MPNVLLIYPEKRDDVRRLLMQALSRRVPQRIFSESLESFDYTGSFIVRDTLKRADIRVLIVFLNAEWFSLYSEEHYIPPMARVIIGEAQRLNTRIISITFEEDFLPGTGLWFDGQARRMGIGSPISLRGDNWDKTIEFFIKAIAEAGIEVLSRKRTVLQMRRDFSMPRAISYDQDREWPRFFRAPGHGAVMRKTPPQRVQSVQSDLAPVYLGASAPRSVAPGIEFTARFLVYVKDCEDEVRRVIKEVSPSHKALLGLRTCQWKPGIKVLVCLAAQGLDVTPSQQEFVWPGTLAILDFDLHVPLQYQPTTTVLKFDVFIEQVRVSGIRVDLKIVPKAHAKTKTFVRGRAARTAFASYSSHDRLRVLDRIAAIEVSAGIEVFEDCLSLHPGEVWKSALEKEILNRDLFLLFWSRSAARSQWVTWEWKTALREKGRDVMQLHPLEIDVKPPRQLMELHFGDVHMLARKAYENGMER